MEEGLEDLCWELDGRWKDLGITLEWICERANWLHRDAGAPGSIDAFFKAAARLMRLCAYDYHLLGPMFFHAVISLEAMLRVHYKDSEEPFRFLIQRAIDEGIFHDGLFSEIRPFGFGFDERLKKKKVPQKRPYVEKLAVLLPDMRNSYFHGSGSFLNPDFLHMAVQIREMADALTMPRTPEWKLALQAERATEIEAS